MAHPIIDQFGTRLHYLTQTYIEGNQDLRIIDEIVGKLGLIDRCRDMLPEPVLIVHDYLLRSSKRDTPGAFVREVHTKCCIYGLY